VVIAVTAQAVREQVAVVVPVVGLAVDAGQAISHVVLIVYHVLVGCQALAVADGVVGIVVVLAAGVGGRDETIEGVIGVADDAVGGGHGRAQRREGKCGLRQSHERRSHNKTPHSIDQVGCE
jgi:hypothetical protein